MIIGFVAFTLMAAVFTSNKETNSAFAEMFTEKSLQFFGMTHNFLDLKENRTEQPLLELPSREIYFLIGCGPGMYIFFSWRLISVFAKLALDCLFYNYYLTVGNEGIVAAGGIVIS